MSSGKLYYVRVFYFACTIQKNALKGYEAWVHVPAEPKIFFNWHINKIIINYSKTDKQIIHQYPTCTKAWHVNLQNLLLIISQEKLESCFPDQMQCCYSWG